MVLIFQFIIPKMGYAEQLCNNHICRFEAYQNYINGKQIALKDPKKALQFWNTSFNIFNSHLPARKIAILLGLVGDMQNSEAWHSRANNFEDQSILRMQMEAKSYFSAEQFAKSAEICGEILARNPFHSEALFVRGSAFARLGYTQAAALDFYHSIQSEPLHTSSMLGIAALHQRFGTLSDALVFYFPGLEFFEMLWKDGGSIRNTNCAYFHSNHIMILYNLGLLYFQQKQYSPV
jgi:tetratricopeptide (TPR) repeat protein